MARLGELAPVVLGACDEDPVAASIVRRLADEVVAFACAAIRRLELTGADPDVVLGGRLLTAVSLSVVETIAQEVQQVAPDARVLVSPSEPIVGAALLGLDELGADATALTRARAELNAAVAGGSAAVVDRLGQQRRHVDHPQLLAGALHAVVEHHRAERAGDGERAGAGRGGLADALDVDRLGALLHPHVGAAGAAAERLLAASAPSRRRVPTAATSSRGASSTSLWRAR